MPAFGWEAVPYRPLEHRHHDEAGLASSQVHSALATTRRRRDQLSASSKETAVIAVEKAAFLLAVNGVIRGIEIKNDLARRFAVILDEQVNEHRLKGRFIVADLAIAAARRRAR